MYGNWKPSQKEVAMNGNADTSIDKEYDYTAAASRTSTPTSASALGVHQNRSYSSSNQQQEPSFTSKSTNRSNSSQDYSQEFDEARGEQEGDQDVAAAEEALLDLAQLEELQREAERMKAMGNKHMAAQEYLPAYNAYSAALQLSPVGPASHVFLSNRAAALLSLKRYPAAATDARRAVALAPTFGKAHARLGQALYFMKDYGNAVAAYEDALAYEPDNVVTQTYLNKAVQKYEKSKQRGSSDHSVESSMAMTMQHSVVTDTGEGLVTEPYNHGTSTSRAAMLKATAKTTSSSSSPNNHNTNNATTGNGNSSNDGNSTFDDTAAAGTTAAEEDPEFEEAVRIQQRANTYLANKQYRQAIEEYTAALFLVPDDENLSPDLHLGRAHALNGSRRHDSARNDAILALKLQPSAAAYSTLAKSLFYVKDYQGAVDAFADCQDCLPPGEALGLFDKAYLQKAETVLAHEAASLGDAGRVGRGAPDGFGGGASPKHKVPPKLPPPRFVPREQAIAQTTPVRSMPKQWPQQSPTSRASLNCGPEHAVQFLTEPLGIKLNRGSDGVVRVLSVSHHDDRVVRRGDISAGDVVREAAGVDIRRPITNIMWGDTVALIKMAPRPISLIVAEELSAVPYQVLEEQRKVREDQMESRPSRASDDGAVEKAAPAADGTAVEQHVLADDEGTATGTPAEEETIPVAAAPVAADVDQFLAGDLQKSEDEDDPDDDDIVEVDDEPDPKTVPTLDTVAEITDEEKTEASVANSTSADRLDGDDDDDGIESVEDETATTSVMPSAASPDKNPDEDGSFEVVHTSLRDEEDKVVGGEILFLRDSPPSYSGWDTLRWMAYNGARKVNFCQPVYRQVDGAKKRKGLPMFWKTGGVHYEERALIVYDEPRLFLIVRRPTDLEEIRKLLGLPDLDGADTASGDDWALNPDTALQSYWILESVADPAITKLRLSSLTTATSVAPEAAGDRERSCFEILTPTENVSLSAVSERSGTKKREQSYTDSGAFLETLSVEASIAQVICGSHSQGDQIGNTEHDIAWKHQVVMGTLHSLVLSGNQTLLDAGIEHARTTASRGGSDANFDPRFLPSRIVDAADDNGFPALYYAASLKMEGAVRSLVNAGADVNFRTDVSGLSMTHLAARNLDDKSLSTILSASFPTRPDPNALDKKGRTPMYVSIVEGSVLDKGKDPSSLGRCISALEAWGGKMMAGTPNKLRNPISALSYMWLPEYISIALDLVSFRFPLQGENTPSSGSVSMSVSALYQFPVHSALIALRKHMRRTIRADAMSPDSRIVRTLRVLFEHGFEPNERLDRIAFGTDKTAFDDFIGFAPIQILAVVALELEASKEELDATVLANSQKLIADVAEFLLKNGSRLSLDPPPATRLRSKAADTEGTAVEDPVRGINLLVQKLDADKQVLKLLGGEERLNMARTMWIDVKNVATVRPKPLADDDKASIENSACAGGSDSMSCAICWSAFGALINRKHKCRVMNRFVCDDCSCKRLIQATTEHRLSDGQFLLARMDAAKEEKELAAKEEKEKQNKSIATQQARAAARLDRLEAEDRDNRDSIFGGILDAASKIVMGEETTNESANVEGLTASLDQTRDALNQRGEKLGALEDKSAKMVDASADFAKMAKELRKQSEGGFFW